MIRAPLPASILPFACGRLPGCRRLLDRVDTIRIGIALCPAGDDHGVGLRSPASAGAKPSQEAMLAVVEEPAPARAMTRTAPAW